jgi:hypothetical protein
MGVSRPHAWQIQASDTDEPHTTVCSTIVLAPSHCTQFLGRWKRTWDLTKG